MFASDCENVCYLSLSSITILTRISFIFSFFSWFLILNRLIALTLGFLGSSGYLFSKCLLHHLLCCPTCNSDGLLIWFQDLESIWYSILQINKNFNVLIWYLDFSNFKNVRLRFYFLLKIYTRIWGKLRKETNRAIENGCKIVIFSRFYTKNYVTFQRVYEFYSIFRLRWVSPPL